LLRRFKERRCMIADAREMSMACENRLFIVATRESADTRLRCATPRQAFRRLKCAERGLLRRFGQFEMQADEAPRAATIIDLEDHALETRGDAGLAHGCEFTDSGAGP
jgi:hypothetical protein